MSDMEIIVNHSVTTNSWEVNVKGRRLVMHERPRLQSIQQEREAVDHPQLRAPKTRRRSHGFRFAEHQKIVQVAQYKRVPVAFFDGSRNRRIAVNLPTRV